jgi:hypothetical protein
MEQLLDSTQFAHCTIQVNLGILEGPRPGDILSAWYCANVEVARSRAVVSCLIQVTLMASWHRGSGPELNINVMAKYSVHMQDIVVACGGIGWR